MPKIQYICLYDLEDQDELLSSSESSDDEEQDFRLKNTNQRSSRHFFRQPLRENIAIKNVHDKMLRHLTAQNSTIKNEVAQNLEQQIAIKKELLDTDEISTIQLSMENIYENLAIKEEEELILGTDDIQCEVRNENEELTINSKNIDDDERTKYVTERSSNFFNIANMSNDSFSDSDSCSDYNLENSQLFSIGGGIRFLDENSGNFYNEPNKNQKQTQRNSLKSNENFSTSNNNPAKRHKSSESLSNSATSVSKLVDSLPKGITVKKTTTARQVACKSTGFVANPGQDVTKQLAKMNFTNVDENNGDFIATKIKDEPMDELTENNGNLGQKPIKSLKNLGILDSNLIKSGKIVIKTGLKAANFNVNLNSNSFNPTGSSGIFGSLSPKPEIDFTKIPSASTTLPDDIFGVKIKEEKLDEEIETRTVNDLNLSSSSQLPLNQKIKEEFDDYLAAGPSGLNNPSLASNIDDGSIISTKVVSIPASNTNKPREIIVIKKPLTAGMLRHALIVKSVLQQPSPSTSIKVETTASQSGLKISNISSPTLLGSSSPKLGLGSTTVTFPKTNTKIVVNKQNTIYRCQECHLLFTAHSEYIEHIKEHKPHIVFNEKRIIRLEDVQKMNQYQCAQCNAGFPTLEKLSMHENRHKTEFACKYCDKKFLFLYRYKEHMLLHEAKKEKYMECKHCDKKFLKKERYDEHMEMHFPKDIYSCGVSGKKYPSHAAAMEHIKIAHSKRFLNEKMLMELETQHKVNEVDKECSNNNYIDNVFQEKILNPTNSNKIIITKKPLLLDMPRPPNSSINNPTKILETNSLELSATVLINSHPSCISVKDMASATRTGGAVVLNTSITQPDKSQPQTSLFDGKNSSSAEVDASKSTSGLGAGNGSSSSPANEAVITEFPEIKTKVIAGQKNPIYQCKKCQLLLSSRAKYIQHLREHEETDQQERKKQTMKRKATKKLDENCKPREIPCKACDKKFTTKAALNKHINVVHLSHLPSYHCFICRFKTIHKNSLHRHEKKHLKNAEQLTEKKFYKCEICPQSFKEKHMLVAHCDHYHK